MKSMRKKHKFSAYPYVGRSKKPVFRCKEDGSIEVTTETVCRIKHILEPQKILYLKDFSPKSLIFTQLRNEALLITLSSARRTCAEIWRKYSLDCSIEME